MHSPARLILVLVLAVGLCGCSGKRTNVTGAITLDGKPLIAQTEQGHLLVLFFPEDRRADGNVYQAETDRTTGTFVLHEIRAGRYRVAIQQFDEKHHDALGSKYDPGKSPLYRDVSDDDQVIQIDLP